MEYGLSPDQIEKIRDGPAAAPPHGVAPNFDKPPNGNRLAVAVIGVSLVITTLAVLIRFFSKVFCTKRVRLEDYLGLISFPFFIAGTWVLTTIPRGSGFFVSQWNLRVRDLEGFLYSYVLSTTLYCVTLLLAKAAILLEWTHLFVVRSNRNMVYWACYGIIAANTLLYLATIIVTTFACIPRERIWRRYIPGTCIDLNAFNIFIATFHLLSDIIMLLLPQTIIWKLKLATKQKIAVSAVFSAGALACLWAAARVVSAIHLTLSQDKTYEYSLYIVWGLAEVATAQVVFCIPAFPAIFRNARFVNFFKRLWSKITMKSHPQRRQPDNTLLQIPLGADPQAISNSKRTGSEEGVNAGITELQPTRVQSSYGFNQHRDSLDANTGRILITTEIDITTDMRSDSLGIAKARCYHPPWQK
ncbi:hypothetical protein F5X98DRAFT_380770 [Xylaria grammica]|nr:hypothetical protein F5X98DRAFT_380770 [Xylaria grammica]